MNKSVRRIGLALGLVFLALFVNLNVIQIGKSTELAEHRLNRRELLKEYGTRRGEILAWDGTVLARSVENEAGNYKYRREYPEKDLYGPITGYYSFTYGRSGLESSFNDVLLGKEPTRVSNFVDELLGRPPAGNVIQTTIVPELQELARRRMKGQEGAVAVIQPETGAVLALYANPMYDPNPLSRSPLEEDAIRRAWVRLVNNKERPLTFRATAERYPPGSTFKIVTAAAAFENKMRPSTTFPNPSSLNLPDTNRNLRNFNNGPCAGGGRISILNGFRVSCNTTFGQIAMRLGVTKMAAMARKFGLEGPPNFELPGTAPSCIDAQPGIGCNTPPEISRPGLANTGIGQQSVGMTALQMARISATVSNNGRVARPYLVQKILDATGKVIQETEPELSKPIYSRNTARWMKQLMVEVVRRGTGRVVGFKEARKGIVGGKTGTAETGRPGEPPHVWFTAYAPGVAVAVIVENGGDLADEATGGRVAGPIARAMLEWVRANPDEVPRRSNGAPNDEDEP